MAAERRFPNDGLLDPQRMGWVAPEVFDASSGLEQTIVTAIGTMPDHTAWIGTMRGLYRQIGSRVERVSGPGKALEQQITGVQRMPDGTVWVATIREGMYRAKPGQPWVLDTPMRDGRISQIQRIKLLPGRNGKADRLYAMGEGLHVLGANGWQASSLTPQMRDFTVRDIAEDLQDGSLWIATFGRGLLHCRNDTSCEEIALPPGPRAKEAYSVLVEPDVDGGTQIWATFFGGGLAQRRGGTWTRWHTDNSDIGSNYGTSLLTVEQNGEREIWAGTRQGVRVFRSGHWESIALPDLLLQRRVFALTPAADASGTGQVWVGVEGGALRLPLRSTWRIVKSLPSASNGIMSVLIDRRSANAEDLWVVVDGKGVDRYRQGQWRRFDRDSGLPRNEVRNLVRMPDGDADAGIWVGDFYGNVSRIVDDRVEVIPTPWPKSDDVVARMMLADPDSGVWVSITGLGMARYRHGRWDWMRPEENPQVPQFSYAGIKVDDALWFSTREGQLARYRDGNWQLYGREFGLPPSQYYSIALMPDSQARKLLWLGYDSGVQRVDISDPQHPRLLPTGELSKLTSAGTSDIMRDGRGDVLMCMQYGIQRLRQRPGQAIQIRTYQVRDGLPHDECNATAMARDAAGRIWVGTVGGLAVYDPVVANRAAVDLAVRPYQLRIDGIEQPVPRNGARLQLRAGQSLQIGYALSTGTQERLIRYRAHLQGLESEPTRWDETASRSWQVLPAGNYSLQVEALQPQGELARAYRLQIDVLPPWWHRWYALLGYALLSFTGIVLWQRWRERRLQKRNLHLEATVEERTSALQASSEQLKRSNAELRHLSYHDALTGLHNRRYMMEQLEAQWALHGQRGESLALILLDVDHFKHINDTLGHEVGDRCLMSVADCMRRNVPEKTAFHARHGGEEFVVLLPRSDEAQAVALAESLRQAFSALLQPPMTASFGVAAAVPTPGVRADSLLIRADHALYASKHNGRNRVTAASAIET